MHNSPNSFDLLQLELYHQFDILNHYDHIFFEDILLHIPQQNQETTRSNVDQIFFKNPDLYKLNWFRNSEWKQSQNNKIENYKT